MKKRKTVKKAAKKKAAKKVAKTKIKKHSASKAKRTQTKRAKPKASKTRTIRKKVRKIKPAKSKASKRRIARVAGAMVLCEFCGNAIPKERLDILPDTTTCVECSQTQPYSESEILSRNGTDESDKNRLNVEDFEEPDTDLALPYSESW